MLSSMQKKHTGARMHVRSWWLLAALMLAPVVHAGGGPLGIDNEWSYDAHGVWSPNVQRGLELGVLAVEGAGALWLGNDDPLGHTFWQAADSTVVSAASAEILKYAFSRARPDQGNDPNKWFRGGCCDSFPSGQVTIQASAVTPFIVNYHKTYPWVWALEALPLYDSIARLKSQEHWQTDVLAGWALGTAGGYWATTRNTPLLVEILPGGLSVGFSKHF
jgi:hypothetical protein